MAAALSGIDIDQQKRLKDLIAAANLPTDVKGVDTAKLRAAMNLDKKVVDKKLRFILLESLGEAYIRDDVPEERLAAVLARAGT